MSANEDAFKSFLEKNNIDYKIPSKKEYSITDIPFNKTKVYRPDFYLPEKDLYIEIKGFMTLFNVNKLLYLLKKRLPTNFCILQMTDETWIPEIYQDKTLTSINKKIDKSIETQFDEIKNLSAQELHDISLNRLEAYIELNKRELEEWLR
jgi:hypothetical protein